MRQDERLVKERPGMDDMSRAGDEDERRRRLEGLRALAGGQEQQARQDTAPSGSGGRGRGRSS